MYKFVLLLILCLATPALADGINVPYALKSKLVSATRDLTTATGTQAITGFGFSPTACFVTALVSSTPILAATAQYFQFIGMVDSAKSASSSSAGSGVFIGNTNFLELIDSTGANSQIASVSSFDSDGLTLSWTKAGTPTGTASFFYLCFH